MSVIGRDIGNSRRSDARLVHYQPPPAHQPGMAHDKGSSLCHRGWGGLVQSGL